MFIYDTIKNAKIQRKHFGGSNNMDNKGNATKIASSSVDSVDLKKQSEKTISGMKGNVRAAIICALTKEARTLINNMTEKHPQTLLGREYIAGFFAESPFALPFRA